MMALPGFYHGNHTLADSKSFANCTLFFIIKKRIANLSNLFLAQLFFGVVITAHFFNHILCVFRVSPKPQVIRVYAQRRIARMTHTQAFSYFPFVDHICGSVCKIRFSPVLDLAICTVVLPSVQNTSVGLMGRPDNQAVSQGFKQWGDMRVRLCCTRSGAKLLWSKHCRRPMFCTREATLNTGESSSRHTSHYTHGGTNGLADRQALYAAAQEAIA